MFFIGVCLRVCFICMCHISCLVGVINDDDNRAFVLNAIKQCIPRAHTHRPIYTLHLVALWLIGTVRAEPETVISRAWVQSPDLAK